MNYFERVETYGTIPGDTNGFPHHDNPIGQKCGYYHNSFGGYVNNPIVLKHLGKGDKDVKKIPTSMEFVATCPICGHTYRGPDKNSIEKVVNTCAASKPKPKYYVGQVVDVRVWDTTWRSARIVRSITAREPVRIKHETLYDLELTEHRNPFDWILQDRVHESSIRLPKKQQEGATKKSASKSAKSAGKTRKSMK